MKVKLEWTEEVSYESVIEVDEAAVRKWLTMDYKGDFIGEPDPDVVLDADTIQEYLQSGDEMDWFQECDIQRDFSSVDERSLDSVELVVEG